MEFNSLKSTAGATKSVAKKDVPMNLVVRLERIEIGNDKPSYFHGFLVDSNEPVSVRMTTIDEGVAVNKRAGEDIEACKARLHKSYVGNGEAHRPRPSEVKNSSHKTHCENGGLLMFTKALKNEDGSYRAHWVETIEKAPGAGCKKQMTHIYVEDIKDSADRTKVIGTQVLADVLELQTATVLNGDNVLQTLTSALANRNGEEKLKPFVVARIVDASSGKVLLNARASAKYLENTRVDNDTGATSKFYEAAEASDSVQHLMTVENKTRDGLIIRAALHGLSNASGYPDFSAVTDADKLAELKQLTDAVRDGRLLIEAIPGQRISAGPATRASIVKAAKSNPNNPINTVYSVRNDSGFTTERRYCETFLTTKIGADGHRYFTKANPADAYPKAKSIVSLATGNDHKGNAAEATARAAEVNATHVELPDHAPFDSTALDGAVMDQMINDKLAESSAALDNDM